MLRSVVAILFIVVMSLVGAGCESFSGYSPTSPSSVNSVGSQNELSSAKEAWVDVLKLSPEIPKIINGVELNTIRGWLANLYPWGYLPEESTVHPVARLWTPGQRPSPFQVMEQCRQIKESGGGASILEYNPNPITYDHNYWLSNDFASVCGPFFLLYEHINGTRYTCPNDCPKDMSNPQNRKVFKEDIDFMFKNVVMPYQSRYITVNGRAVIYMWLSAQMNGDFASLLEEVKKEYPVFFIGSAEMWNQPDSAEKIARVKALDGFMEYGLSGGRSNYLKAVQDYNRTSFFWRRYLRKLELETGKRYVFIPTFQAAYDDTKLVGRTSPPMYARSRDEVKVHAEMIKNSMRSGVYDFSVGPFVVYSELPEGGAVIESQCLPESIDIPGRFVGCGTARLQILKEYFGGVR
ncbi:MAG TPA: hypothetical protein VJC06_03090 [Candidatus Paceibacterota bacterium]